MALAPSKTVSELFLARVAATPDREAFRHPKDGGWSSLTWKQTQEKVRLISGGLRSLGVKLEERCAIQSSTRIDWILIDVGIMCAGAATTTIYPSTTPEDLIYIINDSSTVLVFAETDKHVQTLVEKRSEIPNVRKVVTLDGKGGHDGWVITLNDLMEMGRAEDQKDPAAFEAVAKSPQPQHLATLIYTSGTTGKPKGVELTHDCWVYEAEAMDGIGILKDSDIQYLWLPLSHSFGKVLEVGQFRIGFASAVDGDMNKLVANCGVVKPTFVAAVPRVFEKAYNRIVAGAKEGGSRKFKIFNWATETGLAVSRLRQNKQEPTGLLAIKMAIADKLVCSKVRDRFGGNLRLFISGSAPLSRYLAEFFHAVGMPIMEGYGLTETSAASFVNRLHQYKFGTVGHPLPGTELKIAEDGEILIRGRGVMRGYHNMKEATAESLKGEWFYTGDIGEVDAEGFLKITDRKKDLIKTSGGKYVAPQGIEGRFKLICPYASQIVIHGDNRNFCSALVAIEEEATRKWAKENGIADGSYADLASNPKIEKMIGEHIETLNKELPSYSTIKKFKILPADLTEAAGDLTPSQKLKRKAVEKKYKAMLDGLYEGADKGG